VRPAIASVGLVIGFVGRVQHVSAAADQVDHAIRRARPDVALAPAAKYIRFRLMPRVEVKEFRPHSSLSPCLGDGWQFPDDIVSGESHLRPPWLIVTI